MKRSIAFILVLALVIGIFQFVGKQISGDGDVQALNVTIMVSSEFGDKAINDSAHDGGEALKDDGLKVKYIECKNENFKKNMMDAAAESDVVVCVGWEFWEITDVSVEYPNVKFIWADNAVDEPEEYPNLLSIMYAQNEEAYLVGYLSSAMSQTGTVVLVAGSEDTSVNDFIVGFRQGAKDCNSGTRILTASANGDYDNPELGERLAYGLVDDGADVVFQVAGYTGTGVYKAAKKRGFYAIGVDKDHKIEFPEYEDAILCSVKKDVGKSIRKIVYQYALEEKFDGGRVLLANMAKGYIDVVYGDDSSTQLVDSSLMEELQDLKTDIIDGNLTVDTARDQ